MGIIISLVVALIVIVVGVNAIQQHKAKIEQEKRAKAAKQKAIIDETEELLVNMAHIPPNPKLTEILHQRSLNAAKAMLAIIPETKAFKTRVQEMQARLSATKDLNANTQTAETFILPDNEQQLVFILQTIKKLRAILRSEQSKGALDAQNFMAEDLKLDAMQLKINIESLHKRGKQAFQKEMLGSARQYFEKALQTLKDHPKQSEYTTAKTAELEEQLLDITEALKSTNAADAAKKAKAEEDDLDLLFQPKKKW
ncbi:hypothetical protein [Thalassotalea profundi]|nr:hypothetical protein [Thalassotalea profundi]